MRSGRMIMTGKAAAMNDRYDVVIIGGGPGGYESALFAASLGMKTALVEKADIGGTCLNHGCIPTKVMIHSADLLREIKHSGTYGISGSETAGIDLQKLKERKSQVVENLRSGIAGLLKKNKVDCFSGTGSIRDPHTVICCGETETELKTEYILIATGSAVSVPPIPGADLKGVVTSDELLEISEKIPEKLVIVGGGVIGMEFASIFSAFGSSVSIVEALPRILPNLDKELSQSLKMLMKKRGVEIHTGASVKEIREDGGGLVCAFEEKGSICEESADTILICTGRKPYTEGLFGPGFELKTERGRILTDENGRTESEHIFAIGDVTGGVMLAHAASAMGRNAVACMKGMTPGICSSLIPSCIYTSPEIASVGFTEDQAKEAGKNTASAKYVMTANGKTVLSSGERGFIRIVYEKDTGLILGAQMMCERATDMISEFVQAIANGLTVRDMQKAVYPHPTFSEGIGEALRLCR